MTGLRHWIARIACRTVGCMSPFAYVWEWPHREVCSRLNGLPQYDPEDPTVSDTVHGLYYLGRMPGCGPIWPQDYDRGGQP